MDIQHVCILIPAKNEEENLSRCLKSVLLATTFLKSQTKEIVLCVDSSKDNTLKIGKKLLEGQGVVVETNKSNVGSARKLAAKKALELYKGALNRCWFANTDADCEVPPDWLVKQIYFAKQGVQGIAGIVKVDSFAEHTNDTKSLFEKNYPINPDGSHLHVHGANLGFRADAYEKAGGWKELATAEDHDLWHRLSALNINLITNATIFVTTSGRKIGRAPKGFAQRLASLRYT